MRVLIATATAGAGHLQAAAAIEEARNCIAALFWYKFTGS